jgi:hypothetical protein
VTLSSRSNFHFTRIPIKRPKPYAVTSPNMNNLTTDDWIQIDQIPRSPSLISINTLMDTDIESLDIDIVLDNCQIETAFYNTFMANGFNILDCNQDSDMNSDHSEIDYDDFDSYSDYDEEIVPRCKYTGTGNVKSKKRSVLAMNGIGNVKTKKRTSLINKAQYMLNPRVAKTKAELSERRGKINDLVIKLSQQGLRNSGLCKELEILKSELITT